jgi:hypothetical protein
MPMKPSVRVVTRRVMKVNLAKTILIVLLQTTRSGINSTEWTMIAYKHGLHTIDAGLIGGPEHEE